MSIILIKKVLKCVLLTSLSHNAKNVERHFAVVKIQAILLIQLGDIGDVVLTMPTIRTLRNHFPENRLYVAVRSKAKELIEDCPWVDGVVSIEKKTR